VARGEFVFDEHEEAVEFIETVSKVRDLDCLTPIPTRQSYDLRDG